jgi:predicted HTH transcriptional regulator
MFDDRLEIYSPGGVVDGTILDNKEVTSVPSKRRNPVLADIFNRLNYMERRGSGFKKIMDDYKFQENYKEKLKPEFYAKYDSFILTLYNLNYQEQYLANPQSGSCPFFKAGDTSLLKRTSECDDFYNLKNGKFCGEGWMLSADMLIRVEGGNKWNCFGLSLHR